MTSLPPLLWCHYLLYYDVTNPSTMTSLPPLLWRHYPNSNMTSLPPLLWRRYPLYYDVTNSSTMTSLTPLLCRHWPLYYDITNHSTMTSPGRKLCRCLTSLVKTTLSPLMQNLLVCAKRKRKFAPGYFICFCFCIYISGVLYLLLFLLYIFPGYLICFCFSLIWLLKPAYYDVTTPATMTSLPPLLWRHCPCYYDGYFFFFSRLSFVFVSFFFFLSFLFFFFFFLCIRYS